MQGEIQNSYGLLIETLRSTLDVIENFKELSANNTEISIQIGIISNVIKSFEGLKEDLIRIDSDINTKKDVS